jgi:tetratricopeptide (TPR) repeat protein
MSTSTNWQQLFLQAAKRQREYCTHVSKELAKEALEVAQSMPHGEMRVAAVLACEGLLAYCRKRTQRAESLFESALLLPGQSQLADIERTTLILLADVKMSRGKPQQASMLYTRALALDQHADDIEQSHIAKALVCATSKQRAFRSAADARAG